MTQQTRKILFILFIIIFATVTPLTILYTSGYKFVFSWPLKPQTILQKTGMFIIETKPSGARIYLNDEPALSTIDRIFNQSDNQLRTPAKIKSLLPGEYNLRIEMDGYWNWQKKLVIKSGKSTVVPDIILVKKGLPIKVSDIDNNNIAISPNSGHSLIKHDGEIIALNNDTEEMKSVEINYNASLDDIKWSKSGRYAIINNIVINIKDLETTNLNDLFGANLNNLAWSKTDEDIIFFESANSIKSFNLKTKELKTISDINYCCSFLVDGDDLYLVSYIRDKYLLKKISISDKILLAEIELPYSNNYKLLKIQNNLINLHDEGNKLLYLIDFDNIYSPLRDVISGVKYYQWANNGVLVYADDFEIWKYNLNNLDKTLLTRISEPVTDVFYQEDGGYVLFATNKTINYIETITKGHKNITTLVKLDEIIKPSFNHISNTFIFGAGIGEKYGVYRLEI